MGGVILGCKNEYTKKNGCVRYSKIDNKNTMLWFISRFETKELYNYKYKEVLGKEWG